MLNYKIYLIAHTQNTMKAHMRMSSQAASVIRARNAQRADVSRFTHLLQNDRFETLSGQDKLPLLHTSLLEGLAANNYTYLTVL